MTQQQVRRSGLTMPVVTQKFVDNAWRRGCDFIVLDLEDSVPSHLKAQARGLVKNAIPNVAKGGAEVFVRINHDQVDEDLEAVVWPGLKRIKYPKAESGAEIEYLDAILTRLESERGIPPGTIEIDPAIETATGAAHAFEIAGASPRVREFAGSASGYDLSRDLGVDMFVDFDQFIYLKGEAELAARACGLMLRGIPFVPNKTGSVSDANRALRQAEASRKCGFRRGTGGLNPAVVESHNIGFTPSEGEIHDAHWVLERYRELLKSADPWIQIDGRVIDHYEAARAVEILEWAEACGRRNQEKAAAVARQTPAP